MSFFIPRKREYWQRRPTSPVELNTGHVLSPSYGLWLFDGAGNLAQQNFPTIGSSVEQTPEGLSFSGAENDSNSVDLNPGSSLPEDMTISMIGSPSDLARDHALLHAGNNQFQWWIDTSGGSLRLGLFAGAAIFSTQEIPANKDSVLSATCKGVANTGRAYIDGGLAASGDIGSNSWSGYSASTIRIGTATNGKYYKGLYSYLYIDSVAREDAEVQALAEAPYQILKPRRSYWHMPVAAGGVTVEPPTGSITYTGYAPTVTAGGSLEVEVPTGSITYTGYAPTVTIGDAVEITVPTGSVNYTGFAPTVTIGDAVEVEIPTGSVTYTGFAPTVEVTEAINVDVPVGEITYTGFAPKVIISNPINIDIPIGAVTHTGYAPTVTIGAIQTPDCFIALKSLIIEDGVVVTSLIASEIALSGTINSNGQSLSSKITGSIILSSPICSH